MSKLATAHHRGAVDEGAVATPKIFHVHTIFPHFNARVQAADPGIVDPDVGARRAADQNAPSQTPGGDRGAVVDDQLDAGGNRRFERGRGRRTAPVVHEHHEEREAGADG
jgi:hypothetical protein